MDFLNSLHKAEEMSFQTNAGETHYYNRAWRTDKPENKGSSTASVDSYSTCERETRLCAVP